MKPTQALVFLTALTLLAWRFWSILHAPMSWGMMDDASWLQTFQSFHTASDSSNPWPGLLSWIWKTAQVDTLSGLFRPTYALWAWFVYDFLAIQKNLPPAQIYAFCFFIYLFLSLVFTGVYFRSEPKTRRSNALVYFLFFWSFTPALNLINLISLQERMALLGAGLAILLIQWRPRWLWPMSWTLWMIALGAKATAVVFVVPLVLVLMRAGIKAFRWQILFFVVSAAAWCAVAAMLARHGAYTQRYWVTPEIYWTHIQDGGFWVWSVIAITLSTLLIEVLRMIKDRIQVQLWDTEVLIWPLMNLGMLALMLPWGIHGYYWAIFLPGIAGCCTVLFARLNALLDEPMQKWFLVFLLLPFSFSVGYKLNTLINRSTSTYEVIQWLQSPAAAEAFDSLYLPQPCIEAVASLTYLAKTPAEKIRLLPPSLVLTSRSGILTWWECPSAPIEALTLKKDWGDWKLFQLNSL